MKQTDFSKVYSNKIKVRGTLTHVVAGETKKKEEEESTSISK